eukprot:gene12507-8563_t
MPIILYFQCYFSIFIQVSFRYQYNTKKRLSIQKQTAERIPRSHNTKLKENKNDALRYPKVLHLILKLSTS